MRTIIDIPPEQMVSLDALCKREGVSRAAKVREMIAQSLAAYQKSRPRAADHPAFGIFKGSKLFGDGLEYQQRIRTEWDDRDRAVDARAGRGTAKKKPKKKA